MKCWVLGCQNYSGKPRQSEGHRFHRFPQQPSKFRAWEKACGQEVNAKSPHICSAHFTPESICLKDRLLGVPPDKMKLSADAIPTKNLPTPAAPLSDRRSRQKVRNQKSLVSQLLAEHANELKKTKLAQEKEKRREISTQTNPQNFESHPISLCRARIEKQFKSSQRELFRLQKENDSLLEELTKYKQFYTPGQQQRIVTGKRHFWNQEDISMAATLHAAGSKAYKLLRKRGLPLPSARTLRLHAARVKVPAETKQN